MKKFTRLFLVINLLLLPIFFSAAQSKKELQQKRDKLQKEIEAANKQLQVLSKNKTATLAQLDALKKKINLRKELIGTINSEISSIGNEIVKTGTEIHSLEEQMTKLKNDYAEMIRFAQKNQDRYQRLMFIFASADFNQAYKRIKYLQQINEFRRGQAALIDSTQNNLTHKKSELEVKKNEKTQLRNNEVREKKNLDKEKQEQDKMMVKLQGREKQLRKEVAEKQKAKQKLERALENLVRKEIEAARKKAVASGKKNVTSSNVFSLTPEAQQLSSSFAGNKGSLPWPVESGRISELFGEHAHPVLKGVKIKNDGVDIETLKGSGVRTVFRGEVTGMVEISGYTAVIVRHGEYLSVYSNLAQVFVKKGEQVTTKQKIGSVGQNDEGDKGEINLQIWKGFNKLNPQLWLARK